MQIEGQSCMMLVPRPLRKGRTQQQGGARYGCDIWSKGTDYSAVDSRGGTVHGVCVRAAHTLDTVFQKFVHIELAMLTW